MTSTCCSWEISFLSPLIVNSVNLQNLIYLIREADQHCTADSMLTVNIVFLHDVGIQPHLKRCNLWWVFVRNRVLHNQQLLNLVMTLIWKASSLRDGWYCKLKHINKLWWHRWQLWNSDFMLKLQKFEGVYCFKSKGGHKIKIDELKDLYIPSVYMFLHTVRAQSIVWKCMGNKLCSGTLCDCMLSYHFSFLQLYSNLLFSLFKQPTVTCLFRQRVYHLF